MSSPQIGILKGGDELQSQITMAEMGWETQLQLLIGFSTEMICRTGQEKFAERFEKPFTRLDLVDLIICVILRCPAVLSVHFIVPLVPFASDGWFPLLVFRSDHVEFGQIVILGPGLPGFLNIRCLFALVF